MFAIAEFGSTTRYTQDNLSDRDLLVVCGKKSRRKIAEKYQEQGYSVTLLTPRQLEFMQKQGSLFIQHLKHESRIVVDTNSEFRSWLDRSPFIVPSKSEIHRCISTVEFIAIWPKDERLIGWKADFLYCVSRDLLIKWLAREGTLAFGLEELESALLAQKSSQFGNLANLRSLRESKFAYRSDQAIHNWLIEISRTFGLNLTTKRFATSEEVVSKLVTKSFSSPYELLRCVEAANHIMQSHGHVHPQHEKLMKHIRNPNAYGSSQIRKRRDIERYLKDIIQIMSTSQLQGTHRFAKCS